MLSDHSCIHKAENFGVDSHPAPPIENSTCQEINAVIERAMANPEVGWCKGAVQNEQPTHGAGMWSKHNPHGRRLQGWDDNCGSIYLFARFSFCCESCDQVLYGSASVEQATCRSPAFKSSLIRGLAFEHANDLICCNRAPSDRCYALEVLAALAQVEQGKVIQCFDENAKAVWACFCTGLLSKNDDFIFCILQRSSYELTTPWHYYCFATSKEIQEPRRPWNALDLLINPPEKARFYDDPLDLIYAPSSKGQAIHVELQCFSHGMIDLAVSSLMFAGPLHRAIHTLNHNPLLAVPQFSPKTPGTLQLLLPLKMDSASNRVHASFVLEVSKSRRGERAYHVVDIVTLERGYVNARVLMPIVQSWLLKHVEDSRVCGTEVRPDICKSCSLYLQQFQSDPGIFNSHPQKQQAFSPQGLCAGANMSTEFAEIDDVSCMSMPMFDEMSLEGVDVAALSELSGFNELSSRNLAMTIPNLQAMNFLNNEQQLRTEIVHFSYPSEKINCTEVNGSHPKEPDSDGSSTSVTRRQAVGMASRWMEVDSSSIQSSIYSRLATLSSSNGKLGTWNREIPSGHKQDEFVEFTPADDACPKMNISALPPRFVAEFLSEDQGCEQRAERYTHETFGVYGIVNRCIIRENKNHAGKWFAIIEFRIWSDEEIRMKLVAGCEVKFPNFYEGEDVLIRRHKDKHNKLIRTQWSSSTANSPCRPKWVYTGLDTKAGKPLYKGPCTICGCESTVPFKPVVNGQPPRCRSCLPLHPSLLSTYNQSLPPLDPAATTNSLVFDHKSSASF
ncbi:hypothetical protein O6H91_Y103000 [Diphasiastrum complanatum]|nr:hypothetical protein O6H91_Y103000 [Diphasiastrum complanatum]